MKHLLSESLTFSLFMDVSFGAFPKTKKPEKIVFAGFQHNVVLIFAERTGLEPATSAVTGQHSNQLNYRSNFQD